MFDNNNINPEFGIKIVRQIGNSLLSIPNKSLEIKRHN